MIRLALLISAGVGAAPVLAAPCDRACLIRVADGFAADLARGGPAPRSFAPDGRIVENGEPIGRGQGLFARRVTMQSRQTFVDPESQQLVFYGAASSGREPIAVFARLRLAGGRIAEAELFTRGGEAGALSSPTALLEPDILYEAPVPPGRRSTREAMKAIVVRYMDGLGSHDPSAVPFGSRCDRWSAGNRFTNNLKDHPVDRGGGTCAESFLRLSGGSPADRRFAVVDPQLGIVSVFFIIPHPERPTKSSTNVAEVFKIVDGKIRSIEEFSFPGKYPPRSGFGPN